MTGIEWDDLVQTFATYRSDQSFAMSIGRWHRNRQAQYVDAPTLHLFIQTNREGRMPIMQEKLAIAIARKCFGEHEMSR